MGNLLQDVRYGLRVLRKNPTFTITAVAALALGIGANSAIFSVIDAVLLRPLPFKDQDRLVMVWEHNYKRNSPGSAGHGRNVVGPRNYLKWKERNQVFDAMSAFFVWQVNLTGTSEPERVPLAYVSASLFPTLGIEPKLGRNFLPEEEAEGRTNVAVISESLWQRRFGADRSVLGKDVEIDGKRHTIVGVVRNGTGFPSGVDLWVPWWLGPEFRTAGGRYAQVVAHLKQGVTLRQVQAQMSAMARTMEQEDPAFDSGWNILVVPLREQIVGDMRLALIVLLAAVALVLLIGCADVANLLLARATARQREIAIRLALGVRRGRLVRQLLTESVMLSLLGGLVGLAVAYWALAGLLAIVPAELPSYTAITINGSVLAFTFAVAALTGIAFGLAPALRISSVHPINSLKEGSAAVLAGRHGLRNALVISEAAVTLVLLVGAGLLLKSFVRLLEVDPGFQSDHVLTAQLARSERPQQAVAFFQQVVERLRALPGVQTAGAISYLPLDGLGSATTFTVDDRSQPVAGEEPTGDVRAVTEDYFRAMGIQFVRGRTFASTDKPDDAVKKVIINEAMANAFWPGQDPIGKRISMEWFDMMHAEVIGVVRDVTLVTLQQAPRSQIYWYLPQFPNNFMTVVIRTAGEPTALAPALRAALASIDAKQPVAKIRSMEDVLAASVKQSRFLLTLIGCFAVVALLLAAVGLYGVMSYTVTQRTREMGIRIALGAQSLHVARLVIREGMVLATTGVVIGLTAALALTRFLGSLLFRVSTVDVWTFGAVSLVLLAIALLAVYVPARRASRVDPIVALRYE